MRPPVPAATTTRPAATTTRRDVEAALRHAVLVVVVGLALAVALIALSSLVVLASFVLAAGAVLAVRSIRSNEVRRDFRASFSDAWNAAIDAVTQNGFQVGEPTWYAVTEGRIRAGNAVVALELHPGGVVRVRVRIGTFGTSGSRRLAALVLEGVAQRVN
jgi:hypothetical protein